MASPPSSDQDRTAESRDVLTDRQMWERLEELEKEEEWRDGKEEEGRSREGEGGGDDNGVVEECDDREGTLRITVKHSLPSSREESAETASKQKPTKRNILSILSSFYDPTGFIQFLTITMKVLSQDICKSKINCDDELSQESKVRWFKIIKDISHNNSFESVALTWTLMMASL